MGVTAHWLTIDQALMFWGLCHKLNLQTEEQRTTLLNEMAKQGFVSRVWKTKRSKEQFIKDMSKHYKTLVVQNKSNAKLPN